MALALASFWNPGYSVQTWHVFLIFQAMNFLMVAYNIFLLKRTIWLQDVGCECLSFPDPLCLESMTDLLLSYVSSLPFTHSLLRHHHHLPRRVEPKTKQRFRVEGIRQHFRLVFGWNRLSHRPCQPQLHFLRPRWRNPLGRGMHQRRSGRSSSSCLDGGHWVRDGASLCDWHVLQLPRLRCGACFTVSLVLSSSKRSYLWNTSLTWSWQ